MLNNKGQSLVLFVVIIPILLFILILVIDIGKAINLKQELNNINKIVLDYGLDNLEQDELEEELTELVKLNNNEIDKIDIRFDDDKIYLNISCDMDLMFTSIADVSLLEVTSSYVGYIQDGNKRIEKVSGWIVWINL